MVELHSYYIKEPDLFFANNSRFKDPKGGLCLFGPYGKFEKEEFSMTINAGIIGTSESISRTMNFFEKISNRIMAKSKGGIHFPGIGLDRKFKLNIIFGTHLQGVITNKEILQCEEIADRPNRARFVLNLIDNYLGSISKKEPLPDLVYVPIPRKIIELCKKPGQIGDHITLAHRRFSDKLTRDQIIGDYDFHDIIKIIGMKHLIPTQVILPHSLSLRENPRVQFLAQRAWNLTVASYYKAKGIPWKLAELDSETCYAGISFYRQLDEEQNQTIRASIAQLFLATGESIVLRGNPFEWSEYGKYPQLSLEQTVDLKDKIIDAYIKIHKTKPRRLVIHKTSIFQEQEINGFLEAYDVVEEIDLLSMRSSPMDWFRDGTYAIPRGTVIKTPDGAFYIFTLGYIPQLDTFPKTGIPIPIEVNPFTLDSPEQKMWKEILSLTKLNWNNANFCDQMPITITAAQRVSGILSEARIRDVEIMEEYRYYI